MSRNFYLGSVEHKTNARLARQKGRLKALELVQERKQSYEKDPKFCKCCLKPLPYKGHKFKTFCNNSCAATWNNRGKSKTVETKTKISQSSKGRVSPFRGLSRKKNRTVLNTPIEFRICSVCSKPFCFKVIRGNRKGGRKTCSRACRTHASVFIRPYQNGSRKTQWYFNKWENKDVLLESSWEVKVAQLLDEKSVEWSRPKPIIWTDSKQVEHLYYPDFYLPKQNVYLDPKNPYCLKKDKEKLNVVGLNHKIVYGHLNVIVQYIESTF